MWLVVELVTAVFRYFVGEGEKQQELDWRRRVASSGSSRSEGSPFVVTSKPDHSEKRENRSARRKNRATRKSRAAMTAWEVVDCGVCGLPTPVPPVCDTCGIKACGPCMVGTSCRRCAQRVSETSQKVVRNLPATSIRRSPNSVRRSRRRQVSGKATEVPNRARSPDPPPVAKPPPTPAQQITRALEHGNKKMISITTTDPIERIRSKAATFRASLSERHVKLAEQDIPGCSEEVAEFQDFLTEIDSQLDEVPSIDVAFLGPSRHGKSTLLNALAASSILPMSDIKPCTASIVSMVWAEEWSLKINFVHRKVLREEKKQALEDAEEYLERLRKQDLVGDEPDDPRYLNTLLQRFITLYQVDEDQPPQQLVNAIRDAEAPPEIARLLGQVARPVSKDIVELTRLVEKYLSTKSTHWTIVDKCEVRGPFSDWHEQLHLVDLPGTNDTNPHRTKITASLREKAKAVAICTSDSNLGIDIEEWLRHSSVLRDFVEATEQSRQRIFILRTKFDSYHPEIDESQLDPDDEESEERLYREALERHRREQTESYHNMFRDIASPVLPLGDGAEETRKRDEMLARIRSIPVFFVSALAHEVFEGRYSAGRKTKNRLSEQFNDEINETQIPALRAYLNEMAQEYLHGNYYEDLERRLEKEADQLVRFFRKWNTAIEADLSGASGEVNTVITTVQSEVVPWVDQEISTKISEFRADATGAGEAIRHRMDQAVRMSKVRLEDKMEIWSLYAWNSLKATARKGGSHTTCRGKHIDINNDICSLLVDDVILAWSSYRDFLVSERLDRVTRDVATELERRMQVMVQSVDLPAAKAAVRELVEQIGAMAQAQRERVVAKLNKKIRDLESIRQPSYVFIQELFASTYDKMSCESGTGCRSRMQKHLFSALDKNWDTIRQHISSLVASAVGDLMDFCCESLESFSEDTSHRIESSLDQIGTLSASHDRTLAQKRLETVKSALRALPAPQA